MNLEKATFIMMEAAVDLILCSGIRRTVVYGVKAVNSTGEELVCFSDLCTDRMLTECFVKLCNAEEIHPLHAYDVVRDFAMVFCL